MTVTASGATVIITVMPANTTERPAVLIASEMASGTELPRASAARWRATMRRA